MEEQRIWSPRNELSSPRYLWTDAHGLCTLVSLFHATPPHRREERRRCLAEAELLVENVYKALGTREACPYGGLRIGEEPDRDGQYFHYLMKWAFALSRLSKAFASSSSSASSSPSPPSSSSSSVSSPSPSDEAKQTEREEREESKRKQRQYHQAAVRLVKQIHRPFVVPGVGVLWKMKQDLSGPYPGYGLGALDHYDGYVTYRLIASSSYAPYSSEEAAAERAERRAGGQENLEEEIEEMRALVMKNYKRFVCEQDLGLGESLWLTHWFPQERWAQHLRKTCLRTLDRMWVEGNGDTGSGGEEEGEGRGGGRGYFCRHPEMRETKYAFTNYGVSIGLQAVEMWPDRVKKLNGFFETYRSGDEYDTNAITHVMACSSWMPGVFLRQHASN
ncbi:Ldi domain-containing protein [Balamuthia mandrillaris]